MVKVYLHYEGSHGPEYTEAMAISTGETLDDILARFVSVYNKQHEKIHSIGKGKLNILSLSLRKTDERRPLSFALSSKDLLEEIEDREDLLVEDLEVPRKATTTIKKKNTDQEKQKGSVVDTTAAMAKVAPTTKSRAPPPADHPEVKRAKTLLKERQYRQCRETLLALKKLASYQKCIPLLITLCECYIEMKEYRKAIACAEEIIAEDPDRIDGYFYKALGHKHLKEYRLALKGFGRTTDILTISIGKGKKLPKDVESQLFDAVAFQIECLFHSGDHQEAAATVNESMAMNGMDENINFLIAYSQIALGYNKVEEAARCLLKSIVVDQNNKRARELLVVLLKKDNGFQEVEKQVKPTPQSAAAYALFATFAKDVSELELSSHLYELSMRLLLKGNTEQQRTGASYVLNLAHVYEAMYDLNKVFDCMIEFLKENLKIQVGNKDGFTCADLYEATRISEVFEGTVKWCNNDDGYIDFTDQISSSSTCTDKEQYDLNSLDLLAVGFTMVKVLYAQGKFSMLPSLFRLIEPTRRRSATSLHETHIRNENAYYFCIAQVMAEKSANAMTTDVFTDVKIKDSSDKAIVVVEGKRNIYVCGDSHVMPVSWVDIEVKATDGGGTEKALLIPKLVTGVKQWHLRDNSNFYPKANFLNAIKSVPKGAEVVMMIGEIDCREGIFTAIEKGYYESVEEGIKATVGVFISLLKELIQKKKFKIYIHPILPVLNETREMVKLYNSIYKSEVDKMSDVKWLDFFDDLLTPDRDKLKPEYQLDGTHISPKYISLLESAL